MVFLCVLFRHHVLKFFWSIVRWFAVLYHEMLIHHSGETEIANERRPLSWKWYGKPSLLLLNNLYEVSSLKKPILPVWYLISISSIGTLIWGQRRLIISANNLIGGIVSKVLSALGTDLLTAFHFRVCSLLFKGKIMFLSGLICFLFN